MQIFLRTFAQKMLRLEPSKVREEAIAWLGGLLGEFRSKCGGAQSVRMGDVVAPSGLAWAFSYIHSFLNSRLFLNYTKISSDARINEFLKLSALNPYFFASRYYSHLYPLTLDIYDNEPLPGDFI